MWANSHDLVNKILNADDVVLAQALLDDLVVGQRNPLLVQLPVAPLVDQLPDTLQVRVPTQILIYLLKSPKTIKSHKAAGTTTDTGCLKIDCYHSCFV
uniref:60S ribosomal protein L7-2 n=1 Tax=Arundo donax TaxID=35708 RepID=A0A0A9DVT3_ARUDO